MTPGQAAYEALHASIARRQPGHLWVAWYAVSEINDGIPGEPLREDLEAAAQAAIGRAADELAKLREALADLLGEFSARAGDGFRARIGQVQMQRYLDRSAVTPTGRTPLQTPGTQPGQQETNQEGTK